MGVHWCPWMSMDINAPGLAQGVSDHWQQIQQAIIEWSQNPATVSVFVIVLLLLVQLLNNSLTRGDPVREPWDTSTVTCLHFGVHFLLSVFLHHLININSLNSQNGYPQLHKNHPKPDPEPIVIIWQKIVLERPYPVFFAFWFSTCSKWHPKHCTLRALKRQWE